MKRLIIFTDLDGTILDYSTYSFEAALPSLQLLKEREIPLIICSSKTKKEIEYYRRKLGNDHPFISENGGGIFIPESYFSFEITDCGFKIEEMDNYHLIRLGGKYSDLRKAITELREEGFQLRGFGDMTIEETAALTRLSLDEAAMAKERDFDEPFIFSSSEEETEKLIQSIQQKGFNFTQGRFFHILGNSDKGKAVSILIDLYRRRFGEIITIAIGDSPNDLPMLERVDYPVVVQKPDGSFEERINIPNLVKSEGIGPEGWNKAVMELIEKYG